MRSGDAGRGGVRNEQVEEEPVGEIVRRDESGQYLRLVPALSEWEASGEEAEAVAAAEEDERLTGIAREFWACGAGAGGRGSRGRMGVGWDEVETERVAEQVMARLREAMGKKLAEEKWMFEPTDYMQSLLVANHGRL